MENFEERCLQTIAKLGYEKKTNKVSKLSNERTTKKSCASVLVLWNKLDRRRLLYS